MDRSQIRAARALLGWSQEDLAKSSGVSLPTIKRIEPGSGSVQASDDILEKLTNALKAAGIDFIESDSSSNIGGFGLRLRQSNEEARLNYLLIRITEAEHAIEQSIAASKGSDPVDKLRHAHSILADAMEEVTINIRYLNEVDEMLNK